MRKDKILKTIGEVLSELPVDLGYVFGSFLDTDEFEDVDVAVLTSRNFSPYDTFKFSMQIARELEKRIEPRLEFDVKILDSSPVHFQYEVISKGKLVYCKNELKRVKYEEKIIGA